MTTLFIALASALLLTVILGRYTHHITVVGQLVPQGGVAKVFSPFIGTMKEKRVRDGQRVVAGNVLYVVSSEPRDGSGHVTSAAVIEHMAAQKRQLVEDIGTLEKYHQSELRQWQHQLVAHAQTIAKAHEQIIAQHRLVTIARNNMARHLKLVPTGAISLQRAEQAEADFHERKNKLHALEREHLAVLQSRTIAEETIRGLPYKHQQAKSQLIRQIAAVSQTLAEHALPRDFVVSAPIDGTASTIIAQVGQRVGSNRPLVSILPIENTLEAHLYVDSAAVGYIAAGDPVRLRYHAFPYQRFGFQAGQIVNVAESASPPDDLSDTSAKHASASRSLYLVKVKLHRQHFDDTRGVSRRLRAGMLLHASLARESRRIYEWAFEPLYRLRDTL